MADILSLWLSENIQNQLAVLKDLWLDRLILSFNCRLLGQI